MKKEYKNPMEVRQAAVKEQMLEHLRKTPIAQVACERTGIARATYYRWLKDDRRFKRDIDAALAAGEALINDMSESQLITLIKEKNFAAVRYWLDRHHLKYRIERGVQKEKKKVSRVTFKIVKY